jgi:hypothetical protein
MPTQTKPTRKTAPVSVTADNFNRAESHMYFGGTVKRAGGIARFNHRREVTPIDDQGVIRANRDTLYSAAVFDLDAGPVTITLPDAGKRFMSMIAIDEDQYALETVYAPGTFTYTKEKARTRYILIGIRTFVDPNDPKDVQQVQCAAGCDQDRPEEPRHLRSAQLGQGQSEEGPQSADRACRNHSRYQGYVRPQG